MQVDKVEQHLNLRNETLLCFADKVVALCAGALTLTITFRSSITSDTANHKWMLIVAWFGFIIAIVTGTYVHLAKAEAHGKTAAEFASGAKGALVTGGWFFPIFFIAMASGFITGFAALSAFAIFNLE